MPGTPVSDRALATVTSFAIRPRTLRINASQTSWGRRATVLFLICYGPTFLLRKAIKKEFTRKNGTKRDAQNTKPDFLLESTDLKLLFQTAVIRF